MVEAPINILIVDDESTNLTVLESILNQPEYRLVRAQSGNEALLALMSEEFALLILDINMPSMTGFELAQMIKERKKTSKLPIIFLTAYYHEDQHLLEGYISGAVDYMHKPVNPTILRSKVAVFAELHRKQRRIESINETLLAEIAERKSTEEQLRELNETLEQRVSERTNALGESEHFLQRIIAITPGELHVYDVREQQNVFKNRSLASMLNYDQARDMQTEPDQLELIHPEDYPSFQEHIVKVSQLQDGEIEDFEYRLRDFEGKWRWFHTRDSVFSRDDFGKVSQIIGTSIEVTERKQIEIDLRESDRRKDEFLATLAHELRNPLAPIATAISLLQDQSRSQQDVRELTDIADRHLKQLIRLVDDLLDVARIRQGRIELQKQVCCLQDVLATSIESVQPFIQEMEHELTISIPATRDYVFGDATRLIQVFANILNNAAKYTGNGGKIALMVRPDDERVLIEVNDNGMGIPEDRLIEVFELFTQVNGKSASTYMGLGVGLALAKQLIELHDGWINIYSEGVNRGTSVQIWLPVVNASIAEKVNKDVFIDTCDASTELHRILIVDDLRGIRLTLRKLIERMGHVVETASDGQQALEAIQAFQPDIVFSDISMPGMDGHELASRIREKYGNSIHLVAMTGYGSPGDRQRAIEHGFHGHMTKPPNAAIIKSYLKTLRGQERPDHVNVVKM